LSHATNEQGYVIEASSLPGIDGKVRKSMSCNGEIEELIEGKRIDSANNLQQ
jgi:hypothetical protein